MALAAFYWPPELCYSLVALLTFHDYASSSSCSSGPVLPSSPSPSPNVIAISIRNDAKVLSLHATWRMRNIYLCQLSLIAIQCQHRCPSLPPCPAPPPCLCNVHLRFISVRPCRAYPPDMASDFRFALQRTRNQLSLRLTACPTYPPVSLSRCLSVSLSTFYLSFSLSISQ